MDNWIPKSKTVKIAAAVAALSVLLYFAAFAVVLTGIKRAENFYQNSESEIVKSKKIAAIKSAMEANKQNIEVLNNFFIQKDGEVEAIEQIENIARGSGIKFEISSIDVDEKENDSFKEDVQVKMTASGPWENLIRFIHKLERMPFGVSVEKINLNAQEGGGWTGSLEFVIFREK